MFEWYRKRRDEQAQVKAVAEDFLAKLGPTLARQRAMMLFFDDKIPEAERKQSLKVRRYIEKKLGLNRQTDTASRYLAND